MIRIPNSLNSSIYVQLDHATFDNLRNTDTLLTFKHYTTVKPYLRKKNGIVRYSTERALPNCYLLVKDFDPSETHLLNNEFALKYLNYMHGITDTYGDNETDCTLENIDRGSRFHIRSSDFDSDYAYWCLYNLNVITESDKLLNSLTISTSIGDLTINKKEIPPPNTPKFYISESDISCDKTDSSDPLVFKPIEIANMFANNFAVESPVVEEPVELPHECPGEYKYWRDKNIDSDDRQQRYDNEANLKHAIAIVSLPQDPEFIIEHNAVRKRMYELFWLLQ